MLYILAVYLTGIGEGAVVPPLATWYDQWLQITMSPVESVKSFSWVDIFTAHMKKYKHAFDVSFGKKKPC